MLSTKQITQTQTWKRVFSFRFVFLFLSFPQRVAARKAQVFRYASATLPPFLFEVDLKALENSERLIVTAAVCVITVGAIVSV